MQDDVATCVQYEVLMCYNECIINLAELTWTGKLSQLLEWEQR